MGRTFVENVFSVKLGTDVTAGDFVEVVPDVAMSHDNTAAVSLWFDQLGVSTIFDPDIHFIILDHTTPAPSEAHAVNHKRVREFVRRHGIKNFFDLNNGICHQVLPEEGFALPGKIIVGTDSHTTTLAHSAPSAPASAAVKWRSYSPPERSGFAFRRA